MMAFCLPRRAALRRYRASGATAFTRLARLTLERADLSANLFDDILNPQQVRLRAFEFAERFPLLGLVLLRMAP
jgi:hypothetical protein